MKLLNRPATDWRYRAYFRLMDASAVALVVGVVDFLGERLLGTGFEDLVPHPWILVIGLPVLFLNFIVPTFLVIARFMRDDYAEGLWRRAMLVVGHGVALGPIALLATGWIAYLAIGGPTAPLWLRFLIDPQAPLKVLLYLWEAHMILFVCAFQFLRWRDSR